MALKFTVHVVQSFMSDFDITNQISPLTGVRFLPVTATCMYKRLSLACMGTVITYVGYSFP